MNKFYSDDEVRSWFQWQPPTSETVKMGHDFIREQFGKLAVELNNVLPEGPDKTATLRNLRRVMNDANATIAVAQKLFEE